MKNEEEAKLSRPPAPIVTIVVFPVLIPTWCDSLMKAEESAETCRAKNKNLKIKCLR